eukprot:TRINITY_DN15438_c0_g1_i1.p1 TRINITY_DN15438_c0_g1~~TRINITY_DN15438_c0_g1_i1.p1  ORF type:complete len:954 (+),score=371.09 TRINITY_DN15438_c0_g1_i1:352-2862(+)
MEVALAQAAAEKQQLLAELREALADCDSTAAEAGRQRTDCSAALRTAESLRGELEQQRSVAAQLMKLRADEAADAAKLVAAEQQRRELLEGQSRSREERLQAAEAAHTALRAELDSVSHQAERLRSSLTEAEARAVRAEHLAERLRKLEAAGGQAQQVAAAAEGREAALRSECSRLEQELSEHADLSKSQQQQLSTLTQRVVDCEVQLRDSQRALGDASESWQAAQRQAAAAQQESAMLRERLDASEAQRAAVEHRAAEAVTVAEELKRRDAALTKELEDVRQRERAAAASANVVSVNLSCVQQQLVAGEEERSQLAAAAERGAALEAFLETSVAEEKERRAKAERQLAELQTEREHFRAAIGELESDRERMADDLREANAAAAAEQEAAAAAADRHRQAVDDLTRKAAELSAQLGAEREERGHGAVQLAAALQDVELRAREVEDHTRAVRRLRRKNTDLAEQLRIAKDSAAQRDEQQAAEAHRIADATATLAKSRDEYKRQADAALAELTQVRDERAREHDEAERTTAELQSQLQKVEQSLQEALQRVAQLESATVESRHYAAETAAKAAADADNAQRQLAGEARRTASLQQEIRRLWQIESLASQERKRADSAETVAAQATAAAAEVKLLTGENSRKAKTIAELREKQHALKRQLFEAEDKLKTREDQLKTKASALARTSRRVSELKTREQAAVSAAQEQGLEDAKKQVSQLEEWRSHATQQLQHVINFLVRGVQESEATLRERMRYRRLLGAERLVEDSGDTPVAGSLLTSVSARQQSHAPADPPATEEHYQRLLRLALSLSGRSHGKHVEIAQLLIGLICRRVQTEAALQIE